MLKLYKHQEEVWKTIPKFPNYEVSNKGEIRNKARNNSLKGTKHNGKQPYLYVTLRKNNESYKKFIHRIVAKTFIENPEMKPQVNHIDGNPLNNNVENLEWATNSENTLHAYENGLRKSKTIYIKYKGEIFTLRGLCEKLKLNYKTVHYRYRRSNWNILDALNMEGGDRNHVKVVSTPETNIR